ARTGWIRPLRGQAINLAATRAGSRCAEIHGDQVPIRVMGYTTEVIELVVFNERNILNRGCGKTRIVELPNGGRITNTVVGRSRAANNLKRVIRIGVVQSDYNIARLRKSRRILGRRSRRAGLNQQVIDPVIIGLGRARRATYCVPHIDGPAKTVEGGRGNKRTNQVVTA